MSKHDNNIVTYAAPHTIKKFELIEAYVDRWSRKILEFDKSKGVIYIDCMSNSGMYFDDNGNPIEGTAIRVAKKLNEIILKYPTKKAVLIFNDISKSRIDFLKKEIEKRDFTNIEVLFYNEDSSQFLNGLALDSWNDFNTLLIYDPYKAEIDWQAISRFLNVWGEVIINHMVSDTIRGASQAKKEDVKRRYEETYQKDIDAIIEMGKDKEQLEKVIKGIIDRKSDKKHHVASFPFFTRTNGLLYNLIFCSTHIAGLILYKEIVWKTFGDKSSLKNIRDDSINQPCFDFGVEFELEKNPDTDCYTISDIAKYIYETFNTKGNVSLKEIYAMLDEHPIFPTEGYKNKIKAELKKLGVQISNSIVSFPINKGEV